MQPEDAPTALDDFHLQMTMLDFLHRQYPRVKVALHAGELTDGLVPPEDLRDHIRQSIDVGHASRIGHGVDVMSEDHPVRAPSRDGGAATSWSRSRSAATT